MKKIISIILILCLVCKLSIFKSYTNDVSSKTLLSAMSERSTNPYNALKSEVESNYNSNGFNKDIKEIRNNMALGYNFGNELDFPSANRKYKIRITLGNDEDEYLYYEAPLNDEGNIFTIDNRSSSDRTYAKIKFEKVNGVNVDNSTVINNMKIYISNDFDQAYNKELTASISYIILQDKDNNYVITNPGSTKTYSATLTSSEAVEIYNKSITSTYGALSDSNVYLRLAFQLENYISDYKNHATDIYSVTYNGVVATDDELQFLKEQGFKSIRIPVTWYSHMDATGKIDPDWFEEVNKVVNRIISYGFYVTIDIHHDGIKNGWLKADAIHFESVENTYRYLVLQIANNFKNYDEHLILEGPNEVLNYKGVWSDNEWHQVSQEDYDTLNRINQIFVDEVRRVGHNNTNRIILLNTYAAGFRHLNKFVLPSDSAENKILVGIHSYVIKDNGILEGLDYLANEGKEYLNKYNLILGEFGIDRSNELSNKLDFMGKNMSLAASLGLPVMYWDDGGNYALMRANHAYWYTNYNSDQVAEKMISTYYNNFKPDSNNETTIDNSIDEKKKEIVSNPKTGVITSLFLLIPLIFISIVLLIIKRKDKFKII